MTDCFEFLIKHNQNFRINLISSIFSKCQEAFALKSSLLQAGYAGQTGAVTSVITADVSDLNGFLPLSTGLSPLSPNRRPDI